MPALLQQRGATLPCQVSGMMVVESSGLSEPWFDQLKGEDEAGKISLGMNPQQLAPSLPHSRYEIPTMKM